MAREPGWPLLSSEAPEELPRRWCPVGPVRLDSSHSLLSLLVLRPEIRQRTAPSHQPLPEVPPLYWPRPSRCALPSDLFLAHLRHQTPWKT